MGCTNSKSKAEEDKPRKATKAKPIQENKNFDNNLALLTVQKTSINVEYKFAETLYQGKDKKSNVKIVHHLTTGIVRALKQIKKSIIEIVEDQIQNEIAKAQEEQDLIENEIAISMQIEHPNIIKFHEIFEDEYSYYMICDYYDGGLLFNQEANEKSTEQDVANYMKQLLSAIFYCHANKIIHRDIQPENILFDSKDIKKRNLKLIDFGSSIKQIKNVPNIGLSKKVTKYLYTAPEVLRGDFYDEKCDLWSCGIILYLALSGQHPYQGSNEKEILQQVENIKLSLLVDPNVSNEAKDLISKMLHQDPKKRISAENAYKHKWIKESEKNLHPISQKVIAQLSEYNKKNLIKDKIISFMSNHVVTEQENEQLIQTFKQLDKNGDGMLDKQEIIDGLSRIYEDRSKAELMVDQIMTQVDINKSDKISITEFITATIEKTKLFNYETLNKTFKLIDKNGDGHIDKKELQSIMGTTQFSQEESQNFFQSSDSDKDLKISQQEFMNYLLNNQNKSKKKK